jgi:cysteinyl-tRNA synthetase
VDDKIIAQSIAESIPASEVARKYTEAYFVDADSLGLMRANFYPRATEHIEDIIRLVTKLIEQDKAYVLGGDVYFSVPAFPEYGKLSKQKMDEVQAGSRIEVNEGKKSPLDFALWKQAKEGEPYWESPWGKGRPGWHIECSAMAMSYLGETLDFHGGGSDLIFPHHENEIAQSEAATGKPFVRFWLHNGLLQVKGERMGKSMGNFLMVRELLKTERPATLRYFLLSAAYAHPLDYNEESLNQARAGMEEFNNTLGRIREHLTVKPGGKGDPGTFNALREKIRGSKKDFQEAMDDDLNTPRAFAALFELTAEVKNTLGQKGLQRTESSQKILREAEKLLQELGNILGIVNAPEGVDRAVKELAKKREEARSRKDWAQADQVRKEIEEKGYVLEDSATGPVIIKKY